MKCKYCGSNLTIDDERCSFCGKENTHAVKHRSKMKQYAREFERTKQTVEHNAKKINKTAIRIAVLSLLLVVNLVFLLLNTEYEYDIRAAARSSRVEKNWKEHKETMDTLEANRDFFELSHYYKVKELEYNERFLEYDAVARVCTQYYNAYIHLMDIVTVEESPYFTNQEKFYYMMSNVNYMYKYVKEDAYDRYGGYEPVHKSCMEDAVAQFEDLLRVYTTLSDEEIESLSELSDAKREVLIERGLGLGE